MDTHAITTIRRSSREGRGANKRRNDEYLLKAPDPPYSNAKDASAYSPSFLLTARSRNRGWFDRLDFVNLSHSTIIDLFVTSRTRSKNSTILAPPSSFCRRASQIRYFYGLGVGQQQELIKQFNGNHVVLPTPHEFIPTEITSCRGISKADVYIH